MPGIRDFSGGVVNQELQNRDNGNGVLFDCKNVLSSWNGELRKRTGTRYLKDLEGNTKIIPYRLPSGDDLLLLLERDGLIRAYYFDEEKNLVSYKIYSGGSAISFPDSTSWSTAASNTNGDWTVDSNCQTQSRSYRMFSDSGAMFDEEDMLVPGQFFSIENTSDVVFSGCKITWRTQDTYNHNFVWRAGIDPVIQYSDDGTNWTPIQTDVSEPELTSQDFPSGGIPVTHSTKTWYSYNIMNNVYTVPHKYWRVVFTNVYNQGHFRGTATAVIPGTYLSLSNINFISGATATDLVFENCPYTEEDFDNIRWSQNSNTLTMASRGKIPYQISISGGTFVDNTFTPSDYTNLWTAIGYPACVTYYQNRLWFGGFEAFPTRVYGSEFNKDASGAGFTHFTIPSTVTATSPIMADGTEITGLIENMWGGNNALYCLSEDGISMIDAQGAIVAANQVEFKLRNREPVNSMVPTVKDDIMIYLGRDKRKILITDYDFVVQRFKANCISDNYNYFLKSGIRELHYIPRKSSLVYGTLEDGKWFALLFNIDKEKNSLYPFETYGIIRDVQPIKVGDETKLVLLTKLPTYQYILEEKMPQADQEIMDFMSKQEKQEYTQEVLSGEQVYLDHFVKMSFDIPTDIISNLPYIGGEKVDVIADGQYIEQQSIRTNSETGNSYIELTEPAKNVIIGYPYDSYAVLKFITPYNLRKFPKEISINFINSGYLEVGNTFDSLKSVLNNLVESVSISNKQILMNGNYTKTLDKQTFETPYVIVRSDKGLPFIITGIDYKVDMSNYQGGV